MVTADKLGSEFEKWSSEAMREAANVQRNFLTDLSVGLIDATPVAPTRYRGSGHAKRNWRVDLNQAVVATERQGGDPTGSITKAEAAAVIAGIRDRPAQLATIKNPIDWSKQAWFERVVARVSAKYARVR